MRHQNKKLSRIKFWEKIYWSQPRRIWSGANGQPAPSLQDIIERPEWVAANWVEVNSK